MKFELAPDNRGVPDEVLLEDVRSVARRLSKDSLSREEYDANGRFNHSTLVKRFGNWNKTLALANLNVRKFANVSKEECLSDLKAVAAVLQKNVITIHEHDRLGRFAKRVFYRHFGTWSAALREAGLASSENYSSAKIKRRIIQKS